MKSGNYYTPNLDNVILRLNKDSEIVNYLKKQENETISSIAVEGLESGIVYTDNLSFVLGMINNLVDVVLIH